MPIQAVALAEAGGSPDLPTHITGEQFDALANAAMGHITHGVGDVKLDKTIALGYLRVNSGHLAEGKKIFDSLIFEYPQLVAAYIGRGTVFALTGDFPAVCTILQKSFS